MSTIFRLIPVLDFDVDWKSVVFDTISRAGYQEIEKTSNSRLYVVPSVDGNDYLHIQVTEDYRIRMTLSYLWGFRCQRPIIGVDSTISVLPGSGSPAFFDYPYIIANQNYIMIVTGYWVLAFVRVVFPYNAVYTIQNSVSPSENAQIYLNSTFGIKPNTYWVVSTRSTRGRVVVRVKDVFSDYIIVGSLPIPVIAGDKLVKFVSNNFLLINDSIYSHSVYYDPYYAWGSQINPTNLPPLDPWEGPDRIDVPFISYPYPDHPYLFPLIMEVKGNIMKVQGNSFYYIPMRNFEYENFLHYGRGFVFYRHFLLRGIVDTGMATSFTSDTLSDSSKNWEPHSLVGKYVVMSNTQPPRHTILECHKIVANTSNTITIERNWFLIPMPYFSYHICSEPFLLLPLSGTSYYGLPTWWYPVISLFE